MKTIKKFAPIAAAMLFAVAAVPALAQDPTKPDSIVLETKSGSVMTSTGGAFETARAGEALVVGESMMLTDGAKASVVYYFDNGSRKCVEHYTGPNTYVIDDSCTKAAWMATDTDGRAAMIIIGTGLIGAAILANMDQVQDFSSGSN